MLCTVSHCGSKETRVKMIPSLAGRQQSCGLQKGTEEDRESQYLMTNQRADKRQRRNEGHWCFLEQLINNQFLDC